MDSSGDFTRRTSRASALRPVDLHGLAKELGAPPSLPDVKTGQIVLIPEIHSSIRDHQGRPRRQRSLRDLKTRDLLVRSRIGLRQPDRSFLAQQIKMLIGQYNR